METPFGGRQFGNRAAKTVQEMHNGKQWVFEFNNGYGASVVCHDYSYGGKAGLFELGVIHDGWLCYTTPITGDVLGYLTKEQVLAILDKIEYLPSMEEVA